MEAIEKTSSRFARSGAELLKEIRQPVLGELSRALRRAFAAAIDELAGRLLDEKDWEKRKDIDDGLDLLRNGQEGIEIRFDRACATAWDMRTRRPASRDAAEASRPQPGAPKSVLSLIDDTMISDQLQVGRIAGRSRRRMDEEQVDGMRARFGALLGRDWFADNEYPVAPDVVFEALREALSEFGQARTVFYLLEVFEPKISADLAALYISLNQRLIQYGVLPEIRYRIVKAMNAPGRAGGAIAAAPREPGPGRIGHGATMHPGTGEAQPMAGGSDRVMTAADAYDMPYFHSGTPTPIPALGERLLADAASGLAGAGALSTEAAQTLTEQLRQRIPAAQASATRYLSDPERFGSVESAGASVPATENLLVALSNLQTQLQAFTTVADPQEFAGLVDTARTQSAAAADEHGSPLERMIIETVSLIFEQVYTDEEIADAIKQQLLRLQVAAFKAALIDPSFFARPEHPMRQVIERLSAIGADPDFETRPDSPLTLDIADLVTWILDQFERDLALFDEALARIDTMLEAEAGRCAERLARLAAEAEQAERHEAVRKAARDELLRDVDAEVPDFIQRFLGEHWSETIARIRLGDGPAPFDESRALRTATQLLWSIAPKSASEIPKLAAALPQLIADLSRGLAFIAMADAEREHFFSELLVLHGSTIDRTKRQRAAELPRTSPRAAAPEIRPERGAMAAAADRRDIESAPTRPLLRAAQADADPPLRDDGEPDDAVAALRLMNGSEVEIRMEDGPAQRFKLGWMSPARTVYIFTRYPREHRTIRRRVLNTLIAESRFRVLTRTPMVGAVIESLKSRQD